MKKKFVIFIVIIVIVSGAILFLNQSREESKVVTTQEGEKVETGLVDNNAKAQEGKTAPDFILQDFEGGIVKLSDLRGKVVFIDFWTKWCPFCTDEMPDIESIHKEFGPPADGELKVLGIHRTNTESADVGKDFARNIVKVTYPILQDKTDEVYRAYTPGFGGMPVAAWIDKNGIVIKLKVGPKTSEEMRETVEELLK